MGDSACRRSRLIPSSTLEFFLLAKSMRHVLHALPRLARSCTEVYDSAWRASIYEDAHFHRVSEERIPDSGSGRERREHPCTSPRQSDCQDSACRLAGTRTRLEATGTPSGNARRLAGQSCVGGEAVVTLNIFLDSSALAKRYIQEPGSDRVEEILLGASSLGVSMICLSEVISALCRRRRDGRLLQQQYLRAKQALFEDLADSSIIGVTEPVTVRAVELLERWPLRSSDSLQVASAAEWSADLFVSADKRQCAAARGYGLQVEALPVG